MTEFLIRSAGFTAEIDQWSIWPQYHKPTKKRTHCVGNTSARLVLLWGEHCRAIFAKEKENILCPVSFPSQWQSFSCKNTGRADEPDKLFTWILLHKPTQKTYTVCIHARLVLLWGGTLPRCSAEKERHEQVWSILFLHNDRVFHAIHMPKATLCTAINCDLPCHF